VRTYSREQIDSLIARIRAGRSIPRLRYHLQQHGEALGARTAHEYVHALEVHLQRDDLRVFTFLRPRGLEPFWALVSPDSGDTVSFNEQRNRIYSFYRPEDVDQRMDSAKAHWIEVVSTGAGWSIEEHWAWRR
jgi:hypothetical protein